MDIITAMAIKLGGGSMDLVARALIMEGATGAPHWSIARGSPAEVLANLGELPSQYPAIDPEWYGRRDYRFDDAVVQGARKVLQTQIGEADAEEVAQNMASGLSIGGDVKVDVYTEFGRQNSNGILRGSIAPGRKVWNALFGRASTRAIDVYRKRLRQKKRREDVAPGLVHTEDAPGQISSETVLDRTPGDVLLSLLSSGVARPFKNWIFKTIERTSTPMELAVMKFWLDHPGASNAELGQAPQVIELKGDPISGQMAGRHRDKAVAKVKKEMQGNDRILDWMDRYLDLAQLGYGGGTLRLAKMAERVAHRYLSAPAMSDT